MKRNKTIDIFRGLIMIIMALDHASFFVINTHFYEGFDFFTPYPDHLAFFTRWITHLCAPGFFFSLGYGAYRNYLKSTHQKYKMIVRSFFLLFLQLTLINFIWQNELRFFGVITALSISLLLLTLIMPLIKKFGLLLGISMILISQYAIQSPLFLESEHLLTRLFLVPGVYQENFILYAVLPWFGLACIGAYFSSKPSIPYLKLSSLSALIFICVQFTVLKKPLTLIEGLSIIKYPPSIAFLTITMSINFLLMYLIEQVKDLSLMKFIMTYGKSPLLFYVLHLYLYAGIGRFYNSESYMYLYMTWFVGILILYYPCHFGYRIKKKYL